MPPRRRQLNARRRNALPDSAFAYPRTRKYPIDTVARARNALARAAQSGTRGTYAHVAKAVRAKHGDKVATVGPTYGRTTQPGKAPAARRRAARSRRRR